MPFIPGWSIGATFDGTAVCITNGEYDNIVDLLDVTGSCHSGKQALIAGIQRDTISFTMNFNSDATPQAMGISAGGAHTIAFPSLNISIPCRIERVGWKTVVNGVPTVQVSAKYSVT